MRWINLQSLDIKTVKYKVVRKTIFQSVTLNYLLQVPSFQTHLESLKGERQGQHSIRINDLF